MDGISHTLLAKTLDSFQQWKDSFDAFSTDKSLQVDPTKSEATLSKLADRLKENYPFHHPLYVGQMLKTPHAIAWAAYSLAMSINPNNHALDGGPPSSEMEKEIIALLADFFGYAEQYLGHLTSSGTIGNLEALWVAREIHPTKKLDFPKMHIIPMLECVVF